MGWFVPHRLIRRREALPLPAAAGMLDIRQFLAGFLQSGLQKVDLLALPRHDIAEIVNLPLVMGEKGLDFLGGRFAQRLQGAWAPSGFGPGSARACRAGRRR